MWEKKDEAGGLNDYLAVYTWAGACTGNTSLCQPNAAAATACTTQTGGAVGCGQCATGTCIVDPQHGHAATTIWDWLGQLNSSSFAGYSDWRLPTAGSDGGTPELETILAAPYPCEAMRSLCVPPPFNTNCLPNSGCSVATCSCTTPDPYWTAISQLTDPGNGVVVYFTSGGVGAGAPKTDNFAVRAVRGL